MHLVWQQAPALCLATQLFSAQWFGTDMQETFELADKQVTEIGCYSQMPVALDIDID